MTNADGARVSLRVPPNGATEPNGKPRLLASYLVGQASRRFGDSPEAWRSAPELLDYATAPTFVQLAQFTCDGLMISGGWRQLS